MKILFSFSLTLFVILTTVSCTVNTTNAKPIEPPSSLTSTEIWVTATLTPQVEAEPRITPSIQFPSPTQTQIATATRETAAPDVISYSYKIVRRFPHDPNAFTQGLLYDEGYLYESTGKYGYSSIRKYNLQTESIDQIHNLPPEFFGEGLALVDNKLIQLTWKSKTAFIYDMFTFDILGKFSYSAEGWGLAFDGSHLIMSDGSPYIRFLEPQNFQETKSIYVNDQGRPISNINELEYIKGSLYANIWKTTQIAIIDPKDGAVTAWIDLSGIYQREFPEVETIDHLNGIAYDRKNDRLFITGKYWPEIFEIELIENPLSE